MILLFILMLVAMLFVSLFVAGLGWYLYGEANFDSELLMADVRILKLLQLLQTFFIFVVPSAIAACLFFPNALRGLYGNGRIRLNAFLASVFAILVSQYFIGWTGYMNSQITLPESWTNVSEWIIQAEEEAIRITTKLTESNTGVGFIVNVIILAVVPAISEEWLFRGHIQRYLGSWTRNIHVAIFLTSILFAAMHLQFMTFLPRFFLGMILGYLFYYGGNLWYSIIGHFTNNFLALMLMGSDDTTAAVTDQTELQQAATFSSPVVVISALGVLALIYFVYRTGIREIDT